MIPELRDRNRFTKISTAGLLESHVHDIIIEEAAQLLYVEKKVKN